MSVQRQLVLPRLHSIRTIASILSLTALVSCGCGARFESLNQTARGKSPSWWSTLAISAGFRGYRSPHPAAADSFHCLLTVVSAAEVDAVWPGQPPTSADALGPVYGGLVDLVATQLVAASGGPSPAESAMVICRNRWLTVAQAELLAESAADIFLPELEILEPDVARVVARSRGILSFGSLRSLTPAAAAELPGNRDALVLSSLTELSAESAAGLSGHAGPLKLDGIQRLQSGVAVQLAEHVGHLSLNGLRELSAPDAAALVHHRGDLCLNGLQALSPAVAQSLAGLPYGLHLNTVTEISESVAAALSRHRGWCLGLNGLGALPADYQGAGSLR